MENIKHAAEAARLCGTHRVMIQRLIESGEIGSERRPFGNTVRVYVNVAEAQKALKMREFRPKARRSLKQKVASWKHCPHCGERLDH